MKIKILLVPIFLTVLFLFAQNVEASNATIAYRSNTGTNTLNSPKVREWNSTGTGSWGSEVELGTAGSPIRYAVVKYSPVSSKRIVVTLSDDGYLDAYVCFSSCNEASSWTVSNDIGKVWTTAAAQRRFDVEFETATGDAIVVYAIENTTTTCDLGYKVLPSGSSSFSGIQELCIDDSGHATDIQYTWVRLDRDPVSTSEELIVVGFDSTDSHINAWVWNGNSWGNQQELTSAATATGGGEALAVKYAADGSIGMVMGGDGTSGNVAVFHWTGTSWVNTADFDVDTGDALDAKWLTLKADPATDDLQAVAVDSGSDLATAYWNGTAWTVTSNIDQAVDSNAARPADFEWDPSGSTGKLVWDTDTTGTTLSQRTCSPQCTSGTTTISTYAGTGAWVALYRNPTVADTVNILGARLQSTFDIGSFRWDGSSFTNYGDTVITADTTVTTFEAFSIAFQLNTTVPDTTPPTYSLNSTNSTMAGTPVLHSLKWTDDSALAGYIFSFDNGTGTFVNDSFVIFSGTTNWSNVTKTINSSGGVTIRWCVYANDTSNNWNGTSCSSPFSYLTTGGADTAPPQFSLNQSNTTSPVLGGAVLLSVNWTDNSDLDYAILETNESGTAQNKTAYGSPFNINLTAGQTWSNFTWQNGSVSSSTAVSWRVFANDSSGNWNVTSPMIFTIQDCSIALGMSTALSNGIMFGGIDPGQTKDASGNNGASQTSYNLSISITSCSPNTVNVNIKANSNLLNGSYSIPLTNEKFRNSTTDNTVPASQTNISLTTSFADNQIGKLLTDGSFIHLKFNLAVPSGQQAGTYNNTISFWAGRSDQTPP